MGSLGGVGVSVWACARRAGRLKSKSSAKRVKRFIKYSGEYWQKSKSVKLHGIADLNVGEDVGMAFDDILGRGLGRVREPPGVGNGFVYYLALAVDPDDAQARS